MTRSRLVLSLALLIVSGCTGGSGSDQADYLAREEVWSQMIFLDQTTAPDWVPGHPNQARLITTAEELQAFWTKFDGKESPALEGFRTSLEAARKQVQPPAAGEVLVYLVGRTDAGRSWGLLGFREEAQTLVAETNVHTFISGQPEPGGIFLQVYRVKTTCTQLKVRQSRSADELEPGEPRPQ